MNNTTTTTTFENYIPSLILQSTILFFNLSASLLLFLIRRNFASYNSQINEKLETISSNISPRTNLPYGSENDNNMINLNDLIENKKICLNGYEINIERTPRI